MDDTWEPADNIHKDVPELVREFYSSNPTAVGAPGFSSPLPLPPFINETSRGGLLSQVHVITTKTPCSVPEYSGIFVVYIYLSLLLFVLSSI